MRSGPCVFLVSDWDFPQTKLRADECGLGSSGVLFALVFPNLNIGPPVCVSQGDLLWFVYAKNLNCLGLLAGTFHFMAGFTIFCFLRT